MISQCLTPTLPNGVSSLGSANGAPTRHDFSSRDTMRVSSIDAEFQKLLAYVRQSAARGRAPQVVGVTSCERGDGVSTIAANLASVAVRHSGLHVLLVDAHALRPSLHRTMATPLSPGLSELIAGTADLPECLYDASNELLTFLPAGIGRAVGDVEESRDNTSFWESIRGEFGLTIVDLPPVRDLVSCPLSIEDFDGLLLVVAAQRTTANIVTQAAAELRQAGARLLGAVFNGVR